MTSRAQDDSSELSQAVRMFEDILAKLPPGCATLRRKEENKRAPAEVAIVPFNQGSAEFGAMFFSGRLYGAFFGREPFFTTYEAPWELNLNRRDGFDKQIGALRKMCEAVIAGRCEHFVKVLSLLGVIKAGDGNVFRVIDAPVFHPRRLRATIFYESYDPASASVARSPSVQSV